MIFRGKWKLKRRFNGMTKMKGLRPGPIMFAIVTIILICSRCESLAFSQNENDLRLRNLDLGPCVEQGDTYCLRRVPNSFCSVTKNECFCQPSFVAIQEEYGITCKPLLTSLTCRVDKDCVHVKNSICHPGAGFCACPGGTVYVAQEHACRNLVEKSNSSFCETCGEINGICYYAESSDEASDSKFGCACPYDTAMPMPQKPYESSVKNATPWTFCKAILVDIGELCNEVDLLCRPKNSLCSSPNGGPKSCRCKVGYLPVYQQSLHYHECFKRVPCGTKGSPGGACVDLNGDGTPDETSCPRNGSTPNVQALRQSMSGSGEKFSVSYSPDWPALDVILEKGSEINGVVELETQTSEVSNDYCTTPMIHVSCTSNRFLLCFRPPMRPPYQQLRQSLIDGNAMAYLVGEGQTTAVIPRSCVLKPCDFGQGGVLPIASNWDMEHSLHFCVNVNLSVSPSRTSCGLDVNKNDSAVVIKGLLEVRTDAPVWRSSVDMRFDLKCTTILRSTVSVAANVTTTTTAAAAAAVTATTAAAKAAVYSMPRIDSQEHQASSSQPEGSWSQRLTDQWNVDNVRPTPSAFDLSFKAISAAKQTVSKVLLASPIQLKATLFDPTVTYATFVVESCHASSTTANTRAMHVDIIDRGCPNLESGFTGTFLTYTLPQLGRDGSSSQFTAKTLPASSSLVSLISSHFPAFVITMDKASNQSCKIDSSAFHGNVTSTNIKVTCAFRLCAHRAWCALPHPCSASKERHQRVTFMPPKIHFAVRSLNLEIVNPSPHDSDETNLPGTHSCTSVFCQPRVQLLLIMVSLGLMLCLSMICGCLVSRNHYLFHLKSSSSSTSSPNLTICPSHPNILTLRRSSDTSKPPVSVQPTRLSSPGIIDEMSISSAFLPNEQDQNYIQFYNPPPPPTTHQNRRFLPSKCPHEAYQSLPRTRHHCSQGILPSPHIDNRRGLVYANGEVSGDNPTLLVPVTSNHRLHTSHRLYNGTEWVWEEPEVRNLEIQPVAQPTTSTFIVDDATTVQKNNNIATVEVSTIPRPNERLGENRSLCLISAEGFKSLGSIQPSAAPSPITVPADSVYQLSSELYMMPEFSYCLASRNARIGRVDRHTTNRHATNKSNDDGNEALQ